MPIPSAAMDYFNSPAYERNSYIQSGMSPEEYDRQKAAQAAPQFDPISNTVGKPGAKFYKQPPRPPAPQYGTINNESDWNAADEFLNKLRNERSDLFK